MRVEQIQSTTHDGKSVLEITIDDCIVAIRLSTDDCHLVPMGNPQDLVGSQFSGLSVNGVRESKMIEPQHIMGGMFSDIQAIVLSTNMDICVWQVVNQYGSTNTTVYVHGERKEKE